MTFLAALVQVYPATKAIFLRQHVGLSAFPFEILMPIDVVLSVLFALVLCVTAFIIWFYKQTKRNIILILGICGSGKTTLFTRLVYGDAKSCYTSLKENRGTFETRKEKLFIIDIPGHEKLRYECLNKYKRETRACLFVIDSQNIQVELKDVAEFLYDICTDADLTSRKSKILIACNKQDIASAKGSVVIRSLLERELSTVAVTRSGALQGLEGNAKNVRTPFTSSGSTFTFASCRVPVQFVECSAKNDVQSINQWIQDI
ncbi:unnamed protein product [Dicrocoelium dendriticum]|nr:unnamed protein product [Dicrocoelium dendriticum]